MCVCVSTNKDRLCGERDTTMLVNTEFYIYLCVCVCVRRCGWVRVRRAEEPQKKKGKLCVCVCLPPFFPDQKKTTAIADRYEQRRTGK